MILRRVIAHFRKQEWTAIFLDFLIVVVGILIAFQITTWNEGRGDRKKEALYLEELIEDLNADLAEIDSITRTSEIRMAAIEKILEFVDIKPRRTLTDDGRELTFDPAPDYDSNDPYEANYQLTNKPELDGARNTFQALVSTGDLGLIRNRALARKIQAYYSAMIETNNLEKAVTDHAAAINESRRRLGISLTGWVTVDDLGALVVADPRFRAEMETYWTASAFHARRLRSLRKETEALIEAIKAELRR